jgi:hypothetical protein
MRIYKRGNIEVKINAFIFTRASFKLDFFYSGFFYIK